jgi:GNAT superfamily N-acetyltransferase
MEVATNFICEKTISEVTILSAHPSEYPAVKALIIQGLTQRWGKYDAHFNPDLEDFAKSYSQAAVLVAKGGGLVVGCGVLLREDDAVGRIVRMTVCADHQRTGVGRKILNALLAAAQTAGYTEVLLETTSTWQSAVAFYTDCGFVPVRAENGDQHFRLMTNECKLLANCTTHL